MASRPSSSGNGVIPPAQQPNLNPSARSFTPTTGAPSTSEESFLETLSGGYNVPQHQVVEFPRYHYPPPPLRNPPASSHGTIPPSSSQPPANRSRTDLTFHQAHIIAAAEAATKMAARGTPYSAAPISYHQNSVPHPTHPYSSPVPHAPGHVYGPSSYGESHRHYAAPIPPSHPGFLARPDHGPVHTPPGHGHGPDHAPAHHTGRTRPNALGGPFDNAPSRSSSAPHSAGIADHSNPQKTPPNKHIRPKNVEATPPAYTFDDDDEFYPGTDPRLKENSRSQG